MKVLVACEFSGVVRRAFCAVGHDAWSCDLQPAEDGSKHHIQGDAIETAYQGDWDLMIAHPPCTRLTLAGVRWLHERNLWSDLDDACLFFRKLMDAPVARIAIENPQPHRYAVERIGKNYDQKIQPWNFGCQETKGICLWLKGLKPLSVSVTEKPLGVSERVWRMPPGPDRAKERSRFFPQIAAAFAEQWG